MKKLEFLAVCEPVAELVERKSEDYQSSLVKHDEYFVFGHKSYVQMLRTKILRLTSLVGDEKDCNFESIEDSVMDALAYTVFYLAYLQKRRKPNESVDTARYTVSLKELADAMAAEHKLKEYHNDKSVRAGL